ncbi:hypothetical protein [Mesorhizobium humile]|uniref:Uncharacterized protein n=1 Tax=Mesorhizobium humile TaxID=3072313 RepID=A0ABU4YLU7_9HYPH|nr:MULTISPECIES: hypothetical protein [unclassified Mesorhizobium]MDX8457856.1 hypothetical protein [Mesorhizobium sp. VK2D]MDX8487936.1 hypothetical protein [Mesorhizobium sp. VK2B]
MNPENTDGHVLPRPVERLPEYAHAKARQTLSEKLIEAFGLSEASAASIAAAVVDPSEVRKSIGEPTDPDVERIAVPGGTLLGVRTSVWARRTMPDPRNPRTLPSRRHPFAIDPGSGGEDSKFRPVPEPRSLDQNHPEKAELAVDIESRHQLIWASQQAAAFVLAENDWRASIASQGVMEAVWLVPTTYLHADGSAPATTLTTVEGSSRATAVHNLLRIHSADVPYDDNDARFRAHIRKLNDAFERGERDKETVVALRCERIPALILLGFRPHASGSTGFPTAVKSLVALRHVDPPKPWGEGPENESLADEVLDELHRRDLISSTQRDYFAGSCTRSEAAAAHLPTDPVLRAAQIVQLFTNDDERFDEAIRVAVTSQSTRKRITTKMMNELATALILRAVADEPAKVDQIRRYLRHAFGKPTHRAKWEATGRTSDQLIQAALSEVREAIETGTSGEEPGPSSLELAVRASYPLVVSGRLNADRGSSGNAQPDRRTPGEILDTMRRSIYGVHQLGRALLDFETNRALRAVNESGEVKIQSDGSSEQTISDIYLRNEFPPPGKAKAARPGDTPTDRYDNALSALSRAFDAVDQAFADLTKVLGDDSQPLVEARGVEPRLTEAWRDLLRRIDEEMVIWARTFRRAYGTKASPLVDRDEDEEVEDSDPYADVGDDAEDELERQETSSKTDVAG